MNTPDSSSASNNIRFQTEQPVPVFQEENEEKDLTINFFLVGAVINIVMVAAYLIWALGAWKKTDRKKDR